MNLIIKAKVVCWGQSAAGGDCSPDVTSGVAALYATHHAFAAVKVAPEHC